MKITRINDYIENVHEKFPEVSESDIKRILSYCWKMIYLYNNYGNDTLIKSPDLIFFIGKLTKNSLKNYITYRYKLARRIRFMFTRKKEVWDGYYYFTRTEKLYKEYLKQQGGRRKYYTFENVKMYKLLDECKLRELEGNYIFRIKDIDSNKYTKFYKSLKTKDAEFIIQRDYMAMDEITVSENKYKYIE